MIKKLFSLLCTVLLISAIFSSCKKTEDDSDSQIEESTTLKADISSMDFSFSDRDKDCSYEENATKIDISETNEITKAGTYILSGKLKDRMFTVNAAKEDKIQLIFNGITIENSKGPAIFIKQANKVFITLVDGTKSSVSDGSSYSVTDEDTSLDAAIFSRDDLTFNGNGSLTVKGNYKHAIVSKDDLVLSSGNFDITSANAGLIGKDCVKLCSPTVTINAGSDGIRGDNSYDATLGYVYIENGKYDITAGNDALQSSSVLKISNGSFNLTTGGGSNNASTKADGSFNPHWGYGQTEENDTSAESAKAMKAESDVIIDSGSFVIDSADDSIHSNGTVTLSDGMYKISSGDDGIHAESTLSVSGGTIDIDKSYEGLEGNNIYISGGKISIVASDDGLNAAGGNDSSGMGNRPGEGSFSGGNASVTISGGYIFVDASGDGLDSNGAITVSGGITLISGPDNNGNGSFDYGTSAEVIGGIVIATGYSGMAQNFTEAKNQGAMLCTFTAQRGDTSIAVCNEKGNVVVSFTPNKEYNSAVITAPGIEKGENYRIIAGATVSGSDENGFAKNSTVSGGTTLTTINMTSEIFGSSGGMMGGPGGMGGGHPGGGSQEPPDRKGMMK